MEKINKKIFWIASYPKSGNTWIRAIIASLFFSNDGVFKFELFKNIPNFERKENYQFVESLNKKDYKNLGNLKIITKYRLEAQKRVNINYGNVAFFKTHSANISINNLPYTNEETTLGLIYIVRDPRDIVVSYSHHKSSNIDSIINLMLNESVIYNENNPQVLSSWNHHYNSWLSLKVPKLVIKYEDLLNNTEHSLRNITEYFRINYKLEIINLEKKIKNILDSTNFKKFQDYEKLFGFNEAKKGNFFREGKSKQWKKELNKEQINKIEKAFRKKMITLGYL